LAEIITYQSEAFLIHPTPMALPKTRGRGGSVSSTAPPAIYKLAVVTIDNPSLNGEPVRPSHMTQNEYQEKIVGLKEMLEKIISTFVRPNSKKEVNITANIRKPLLTQYEQGIIHPDILNLAYDHVANMLRLNSLQKFLKFAFQKARFEAILEGILLLKISFNSKLHFISNL
jgi:hypothetical protein